MIILFDLVVGAVLLLVIAVLIWYIANVARYLILRNMGGKTDFFSVSDKWLEKEKQEK